MDTLSHYLWAVAILWYFAIPRHWLWGITGALPDLLSFAPVFFLETAHLNGGPPPLESIPSFVFTAYDITHSLIIIGIVTLLLFLFARKWWWLSWGWIFHILTDIPTHTKAYFPTPFLWPISSFTIDGFSWGTWWFMLFNYTALSLAFWWLWRRDRSPSKSIGRTPKISSR